MAETVSKRFCGLFKRANGVDHWTDGEVERWIATGCEVAGVVESPEYPNRCKGQISSSRRDDAIYCSEYCREEAWRLANRPNVSPQMDLLEQPIPRARRGDPTTSIIAALEAGKGKPSIAGTQRRTILEILRDFSSGLNFSEIDVVARWPQYVSNRRLKELREVGFIKRSGFTRPTLRGRQAHVHHITEPGLEELRK